MEYFLIVGGQIRDWCKLMIFGHKIKIRARASAVAHTLHVGGRGAADVETLREDLEFKRKFAATCMLMLGLSEGFSIIIATASNVANRVNYGPAGSPKVLHSQNAINLVVMLIGELVVTEGLIANLSKKWSKRYIIDIAEEWDIRDRFIFHCFYVVLAIFPYIFLFQAFESLCYTSFAGDPNVLKPVLTTCPLQPEWGDMLYADPSYNVTGDWSF